MLLATCLMAFIEIGRHRIKLSKPIGIGIQPPKNLESALLNFALIALIVLNHTSYNFYFKKWDFQILLVKNDLKYSFFFPFQFVTISVGRISKVDFIVFSSNHYAHGRYEHHSTEDHFEKWQSYEKKINLKIFYWFHNICMLSYKEPVAFMIAGTN